MMGWSVDLVQGLFSFVLSWVLIVVGVFVYSLIRAPYEQRDELRRRLRRHERGRGAADGE